MKTNKNNKTVKYRNIEEVKEFCTTKGFEFLDDKYTTKLSKYSMRCMAHGSTGMLSIKAVSLGYGLRCCRVEKNRLGRLIKEEDILKNLNSKGFELLEPYRGIRLKYNVRCIKHNKIQQNCKIERIYYNKSHGLICCTKEATSGHNSWKYNSKISDTERQLGRDRYSGFLSKWRSAVYQKDQYTCKVCGYDKGHTLNAHHYESWNKNEDLRFDINNGVTLCVKCHKSFHSVHGYGNNTKQQFDSFVNNVGDTWHNKKGKDRSNPFYGKKHSDKHKLEISSAVRKTTDKQIEDIFYLNRTGVSKMDISRKLGLSPKTIKNILNNKYMYVDNFIKLMQLDD